MAGLARTTEALARWKARVQAWRAPDLAVEATLSWIRTIARDDDVVFVDAPDGRVFLRLAFPLLPSQPGVVVAREEVSRVRFVVRSTGPGRSRAHGHDCGPVPDVLDADWRAIVRLRDLTVFERDDWDDAHRPLRFGVTPEEAWGALTHARRSVEEWLRKGSEAPTVVPPALQRLAQRTAIGVAIWTEGRLRGSAVCPRAHALRGIGHAARWAVDDARFKKLSVDDLDKTVLQVTFVHAPRLPLSHSDVMTGDSYGDKAVFLSDGDRAGVYLPEIFNIAPERTMAAFVRSLAQHKAGLDEIGPGTSIEVSEVTEVIESADLRRAVWLDGPIARANADDFLKAADEAGRSACAWLARIQREDGALPLRACPSTGTRDGVDVTRMAATAEALAAFGAAARDDAALVSAKRVMAWLDGAKAQWAGEPGTLLLTSSYRGRAAAVLGDDATVDLSTDDVLSALERGAHGPLPLSHALSFLRALSTRPHGSRDAVSRRITRLEEELAQLFATARSSRTPMSLAEWAELAVATRGSDLARDVSSWLRARQLPSGAFPDTTASDFVYSRGTGKVFEVLALTDTDDRPHVERAGRWLFAMQYRPDSMFFVPSEHRPQILGGLRHDHYNPDAWIDAAAHLLLGLARLRRA